MGRFFQNILQLVLAPRYGWEDISNQRTVLARMVLGCLLPFGIVASLAAYLQMAYHQEVGFVEATLWCVCSITALAIGYFVADACNKLYASRYVGSAGLDLDRWSIVAAYTYALLSLSALVCNVLPVSVGLPVLLPLGVGMVAWKANAYLGVADDKEMDYALYVFMAYILPYMLVNLLLDWMIGK